MVPITRAACFINVMDLLKADPHQVDHTAQKQAKQMMGAGNPLTGASKRSAGSTYCTKCGRNHRLGTTCAKSLGHTVGLEAWILRKAGKGVTISEPGGTHGGGNKYHSSVDGKFANAPSGKGKEVRGAAPQKEMGATGVGAKKMEGVSPSKPGEQTMRLGGLAPSDTLGPGPAAPSQELRGPTPQGEMVTSKPPTAPSQDIGTAATEMDLGG